MTLPPAAARRGQHVRRKELNAFARRWRLRSLIRHRVAPARAARTDFALLTQQRPNTLARDKPQARYDNGEHQKMLQPDRHLSVPVAWAPRPCMCGGQPLFSFIAPREWHGRRAHATSNHSTPRSSTRSGRPPAPRRTPVRSCRPAWRWAISSRRFLFARSPGCSCTALPARTRPAG